MFGDVFFLFGYIVYFGVVSMVYCELILKDWDIVLREREILCFEEFLLFKIFGDFVMICDWVIVGFFNDSFFIDNVIIMSVVRWWLLLIDF